MRIYETIYICPPNLEEEKLDDFSDLVHEAIYDSGGKIIKQECWGKRRLAYKINHHKDGIYYYFLYGGDGGTCLELERRLKLAEECIRFLTVRLDKELRGKKHKIFTPEELRLALQMEPPKRKKKKRRRPLRATSPAAGKTAEPVEPAAEGTREKAPAEKAVEAVDKPEESPAPEPQEADEESKPSGEEAMEAVDKPEESPAPEPQEADEGSEPTGEEEKEE